MTKEVKQSRRTHPEIYRCPITSHERHCNPHFLSGRPFATFPFKITMMFGLPLKLQWIVNEMERTGTQLNSISKLYVCGDLVSQSVIEKITSSFPLKCFKNIYGSSEGGGAITIAPPGDYSIGHTGFLVPRAQVKVRKMAAT